MSTAWILLSSHWDELDFNGTGDYLRLNGQTKDDYYYALDLDDTLDEYNNGLLCGQ